MEMLKPPWQELSVPQQLAADFLAVFARCEFALKSVVDFRSTGSDIKPDWDEFEKQIGPKFSCPDEGLLRDAVSYLLNDPPKKETETAGNLDWKLADPGGSELHRLLVFVRRVRNNLFHGAKWVARESDDAGRDEALVRAALVVLSALIPLEGRVYHAYLDWPPKHGW
jgi:hypothetical protein